MTVPDFHAAKARGVRLTVLTAYDYTMARLLDAAGVDCLLVGDSLGMVVQGQADSLAVTMEEMIYHTRMVTRGARRALVVTDMPFMSYQVSPQQALENAGRLMKEGGAHAVKLEGGVRSAAAVTAITTADIPLMGHIGLTPQSIHALGGFKVQGKELDAAKALADDACALADAGCFAIVLECVPDAVARVITESVTVPTIGIGAGRHCDGQVLVWHDLLGFAGPDHRAPKFVRAYASLELLATESIERFCADVRAGTYPASAETYHMTDRMADALGLYGGAAEPELAQ